MARLFIGGKIVGTAKDFKVEDFHTMPAQGGLYAPRYSFSGSCTIREEDRSLINNLTTEMYNVCMQTRARKPKHIPRKIKKYIKWCIEHGFREEYVCLPRCRRMLKFLRTLIHNVQLGNMKVDIKDDGEVTLTGTMPAAEVGEFVIPRNGVDALKAILPDIKH